MERTVARRTTEVVPESHIPITNPTVAQLDAIAQTILSGVQQNPKLFNGTIPMWTPPKGVEFIKDFTDETIWVMGRA